MEVVLYNAIVVAINDLEQNVSYNIIEDRLKVARDMFSEDMWMQDG